SKIGYKGVESNYKAFATVKDIKTLLRSRKLNLVALHSTISDLYSEDLLERYIEFLLDIEGSYLTVSGVGHPSRVDLTDKDLEILKKAALKTSEYGVKLCYHNHHWEFQNGIMDRIINEASDMLSLCIDVYWVRYAGYDPAEYIERYLDIVEYLHLKDGTLEDIKERGFRELGLGIIDFKKILKIVKGKVEWLVIEQDRTYKEPKESMQMNFKYIYEIIKYVK
ncbi:MAG: sugar phosphate isomerase/epimerase, partial [Candidatus Bathyarchaeia archaeon]